MGGGPADWAGRIVSLTTNTDASNTAQFLDYHGYLGLAIDLGEITDNEDEREAILEIMADVLDVRVRDCTKVSTGQGLYCLFDALTWPWTEQDGWEQEVSRDIVAAWERASG
jgi:hypothetical protein